MTDEQQAPRVSPSSPAPGPERAASEDEQSEGLQPNESPAPDRAEPADPGEVAAAQVVDSVAPGDVPTPAATEGESPTAPEPEVAIPEALEGAAETEATAPATGEAQGGSFAPAEGDVLEELTLPSLVQPPEPLPPDAPVGPDRRLRIGELLGTRGRMNRYAATWQDETGQTVPVELREAPAEHAGLQREAEILAAVQYAMLPKCYAAFEQEGRRYLVLDRCDGETLEQALRRGLDTDQALSIALQLVQVVRRLHRAGWALVGLAPADVCLTQPVRLVQLGQSVRIGEALPQALHVAGYSAPELAHQPVVTGKEDVYTLAAILYHALAGHPMPETGVELATLAATVPTPGGPQLLASALAPSDDRIDLESFYQGLLALKQRLAQSPIALEVSSATTVGLNPTRLVNEDSCGYVTWSLAGADGVTYRALLCVADGMGGMDAGEVASQTALNAVMSATAGQLPVQPVENGGDSPVEEPPPLDPVALIGRAASAVHAAARGRDMGTTITCVAVQGSELTVGHIGDTRAYLLRGGELTRLTADHSLVAAMVASGVLTAEEARGHPDSNKVLRSLGGRRELPQGYIDSLQAATGQPSLRLEPGDWIVLCTDGVWGSAEDAEIQAIVSSAADCPTVARSLVDRALRAGAPDNASTVVARCVRMPAS